MSHIGYKRCGDYVVKLEIIEENNEQGCICKEYAKVCNEQRVNICKEYAKFRTFKARVEEIFNVDGSVSNVWDIKSVYDPNFFYKKGELVEVKEY